MSEQTIVRLGGVVLLVLALAVLLGRRLVVRYLRWVSGIMGKQPTQLTDDGMALMPFIFAAMMGIIGLIFLSWTPPE